MKKILVTGSKFEGAVVVMYGEAGMGAEMWPPLLSVDMSGAVMSDQQKWYVISCVPVRYGDGYEQNWGPMTGKVMIITEDHEPDFMDDFWWPYGNPLHKDRAVAEWKKLTKAEIGQAVGRLGAYLRYVSRKGIAKADPYNYLKKKYFNNNYDNL